MKPIVIITAGGPAPQIIINAIAERFGPVTVLEENPESKWLFLKRRAKQVGWVSTIGQFFTMAVSKIGKLFTAKRDREIFSAHNLSRKRHPDAKRVRISSANGDDCRMHLRSIEPKVLFLVGCRILSRETLKTVDCPVINYHAGITPKYRGMMGPYWALATGDERNFGATVHLVDEGVDTGSVLYQMYTQPAANDTMMTYATLLAAQARDLAVRAVDDALNGRLNPISVDLPSQQWFHPPIWTYLYNGFKRRVW